MAIRADQPHPKLGICMLLLICLQHWPSANAGNLTPEATQSWWASANLSRQEDESQNEWSAASSLPDSPLVTVSRSPEKAVSQENDEGKAQAGKPQHSGQFTKSWPQRPLALTGFCVSIAVLAFLGLVSFRKKRLLRITGTPSPGTTGEAGGVLLDEGGKTKSPAERLGEVRNLASAAEKLAEAVDTEESWLLLATINSHLARVHSLALNDSSSIQQCIDSVLHAVGRLHEVARSTAEVLAQDGPPSIADAVSLFTDAEQFLDRDQAKILAPFVTHLHGLTKHYDRLSSRLRDTQKHLRGGKPFKDERDSKLLMMAAADLVCLKKTAEDRRKTSDATLEIRDHARTVIRTVLLRQSFHLFRQLHGEVELAEAYLRVVADAVATKIVNSSDGNVNSELHDVVSNVKKRLGEHKQQLSKLTYDAAEAASGTLLDIVESCKKVANAQMELSRSLAQTMELMMQHFKAPVTLDNNAKETVSSVLMLAAQRAEADSADIKEVIDSTQALVSQMLRDPLSGTKQIVGADTDYLVKSILSELNALAGRMTSRLSHMQHLVNAMSISGRFDVGAKLMDVAVKSATAAAAAKTESRLLKYECLLVASMRKDAGVLVDDAANAAETIESFPLPLKQKLEELVKQLHTARAEAIGAVTVNEKAQAMAKMRETGDAFWDIFYEHERNKFAEQ